MNSKLWLTVSASVTIGLAVGFTWGYYIGMKRAVLWDVLSQVRLYGPSHDDYIVLSRSGAADDIPYLLYGLSVDTNTASDNCARQHCIEALQTITGAKVGSDYGDWTNWWVTNMHRPAPDWHPVYRLTKWR